MTIVLSPTNRTSSTLSMEFGGTTGIGESVFECEINRSPDFKSDISLMLPGITVSPFGLNQLPSGTPYFIRLRSTNLASPGPWSSTLALATLPVTPNNSFVGFSVDKSLIVAPQDVTAGGVLGIVLPGYPLSNLLRDDPSSILLLPAGYHSLLFDTPGSGIDCVSMLGTLAADAISWRVMSYVTSAHRGADTNRVYDSGIQTFRCSPTIGHRQSYHALHLLSQIQYEQYWTIQINHDLQQFVARNVVFGQALKSVNASRGSGSSPQDFGSVQRNRFGTPNRIAGWRGRSVDFELSWLNEAEYHAKYAALDTLVGTTKPVLAVANSKANVFLNDRIAFGRIEQSRSEVVRAGKHSKSFKIESLY